MTDKISTDKEYQTRDGRDVRILCVDRDEKYSVVGLVGNGVWAWTAEGRRNEHGWSDHDDLIEKPKPVVWYGIIYINGVGLEGNSLEELKDRDNKRSLGYLKTTITGDKVEVEFIPKGEV